MGFQPLISDTHKNMKYFVVDWRKDGDMFTSCFDNREEALSSAEDGWCGLTEHEKKNSVYAYYVALYEVDEDGCPDMMLGGDTVKSWK